MRSVVDRNVVMRRMTLFVPLALTYILWSGSFFGGTEELGQRQSKLPLVVGQKISSTWRRVLLST